MGGFNHRLRFLISLLFLLLCFLCFLVSLPDLRRANAHSLLAVDGDSGSHVMKPRARPRPSLGGGSGDGDLHRRKEGNERSKRSRLRRSKKRHGYYDLGAEARTFSAMLPRGPVPPSDSSWCHNDAPDSIHLFCAEDKSTSRP